MIKVEAIVRVGALKKVLTKLLEIDYPGLTAYEVMGHGRQRGIKEHYRDQTTLSMIPKLKIECVCSGPAEARKAIEAITAACHTGEQGDGKIFVYPLTDVIRIRTGEKGTFAINDSAHLPGWIKPQGPEKAKAKAKTKAKAAKK
jgi:nitrogen regulatory protein P-II 1